MKATIASAFDLDVTSDTIESSSIIVADSELHEEESIPTLESYLHYRKGGIGRTTFGTVRIIRSQRRGTELNPPVTSQYPRSSCLQDCMVYAIKLYGHALSRKRDELSSTTQVFFACRIQAT